MTRKAKLNVGEDFRISVALVIKSFRHNEDQKEYEFPSSLTSTERAYVHRYCQQLGLKSKSRGDGANRFLTVYKKEGSTIVQADAVFELGQVSRQHTVNLLQRFPITAKERQELLPPTERDRIFGQDTARDVSRATGRLNTGIPQVPCPRVENEYSLFRQSLPIWNSQEEIIQVISCHQVALISGETGSGKTTQVPQFILDQCSLTGQPCRIICTQPRRIAALTVAERVALERDDKVGQSVGYQIRLESRVSPRTLLTFCTNGVLLRTLMGGDASIATVTHIIVDELHERDRFSDFLLIIMRDLLMKFRNLKLILMSASLDTQLFSKYFNNCPVIEVPGRIFEVKTFYLEDVLKGTGYTNKLMIKYKNDIEKQKTQKKKLDSWCLAPVPESVSAAAVHDDQKADNLSDELFTAMHMKDLPLVTSDIIHERIELDPQLASAMDFAIEDAWITGKEEAFSVLLQLLFSESISVDYQHSETTISPLMLAAGRGNIDVVEQLLALGASVHISSSNDWTAIEWAKQFGHKEIEELLQAHSTNMNVSVKAESEAIADTPLSEEDKLILDAYHHSINDERVDHDLILCLLQRICASHEEGAVLIFLPGYDDIVTLREKIFNEGHNIPDKSRTMIFTLHSQMQSADQKRVFRPVPAGIRKIILSTNIAETSITINDVVFVIDCGKVKEKTFDSLTGVTQLKSGWVSKASAVQRRGRAGRCRPGLCYHLYSRQRFASFQKFQVPEMLRVPIHELCLQAKLLAAPNTPIADFLAKAPDPPPFMVTRNAVTLLKTIDALDPWEELTELGLHLLDLPIEPRLGKMVLYSVILKCLDPVLTIVCSIAYRDPFLIPSQPAEKRAAALSKKKLSFDTYSDHMALLRAFQGWQKAKSEGHEQHFCSKHFLSASTLEMIVGMRTQLLGQLRASGFVRARGSGDIRDLNSNAEVWAVVKAALTAGTYPHLIRIDRERKQLITQKESKVRFHQSSVLNKVPTSSTQTVAAMHKSIISQLPCDWLIYEEMMRTGTIAHAHCCTLVSPITVAIFAGPARLPLDALHEPMQGRLEAYADDDDSEDDTKYDIHKSMFKLDDWISFRVDPEMARLVLQLRQKWHALFLRRMHIPSKPWSQPDEAVVRSVVGVLIAQEQALGLQQPSGVGQRPRPMTLDFCPPVSLGQPSATMLRARGFETNDPPSYHPASSRFLEEPSVAPSSYGGAMPKYSNYCNANTVASAYCNSQPLHPKLEYTSANATNSRIRYFVIKANTSRVVEVSMAKSVWAFTPTTERKLVSALKEGREVLLIFSIQGSGHFQGIARFTANISDQRPPEFAAANLGPCYHIDWLKKANIPFQSTRHLQNAWNENRKVQISRDGQELEPTVGGALCKLIVKGQQVFMPDPLKNRRNPDYGRESFVGDANHMGRPLHSQWEPFPPGQMSTSVWYDPSPGSKIWGPSNGQSFD